MDEKDRKIESGLGEFWDKWLEDAEQEELEIEKLRLKRKKEGSGYADSRQDKPV